MGGTQSVVAPGTTTGITSGSTAGDQPSMRFENFLMYYNPLHYIISSSSLFNSDPSSSRGGQLDLPSAGTAGTLENHLLQQQNDKNLMASTGATPAAALGVVSADQDAIPGKIDDPAAAVLAVAAAASQPSWIPSYLIWTQILGVVIYVLFVTFKLGFPREYVVIQTQEVKRETKRWPVCLGHALVFYLLRPVCCFFGKPGIALYERFLRSFTVRHNSWDVPYKSKRAAQRQVLLWCRFWGVQTEPWVWDRQPSDYVSKNDFFTRTYAKKYLPQMGRAQIVSPVDGVCTWFRSTIDMPKQLKNDAFWDLASIGIPNSERYERNPACMLYLAPNDYHCFHAPVTGKVIHCTMFPDFWSGTVKSDIWGSVNILAQHRRVVVVFEVKAPTSDRKMKRSTTSSSATSLRATQSYRSVASSWLPEKQGRGDKEQIEMTESRNSATEQELPQDQENDRARTQIDEEEALTSGSSSAIDSEMSSGNFTALSTPQPDVEVLDHMSSSPDDGGPGLLSSPVEEENGSSLSGSPARSSTSAGPGVEQEDSVHRRRLGATSSSSFTPTRTAGSSDGTKNASPGTAETNPSRRKEAAAASSGFSTTTPVTPGNANVVSNEEDKNNLASLPALFPARTSSAASFQSTDSGISSTTRQQQQNQQVPRKKYVAMVIVGGITVDSIRMDIHCDIDKSSRTKEKQQQFEADDDWLDCNAPLHHPNSTAVLDDSTTESSSQEEDDHDGSSKNSGENVESSLNNRLRSGKPALTQLPAAASTASTASMLSEEDVELQEDRNVDEVENSQTSGKNLSGGQAGSSSNSSKTSTSKRQYVRKGDKIGCFARGGSLVAMFFSHSVRLDPAVTQTREKFGPMDFKLHFGESLGSMLF
ncbi:unnamed protein product [Amoebophrya sp. A120]|nr:unnamed protein product [Amoebophrya sp. A120]|eukprot:GSA120T00010883001.1